jgi:hypothetical protein
MQVRGVPLGHRDRHAKALTMTGAGHTKALAMTGDTLRMVARRYNDNAARAFITARVQKTAERSAWLEGCGATEVVKLQPDIGAGRLRRRLQMNEWRSGHGALDAFGNEANSFDGQARLQVHCLNRPSSRHRRQGWCR